MDEKIMGKSWENGKIIGKSWENHGKIMGKPTMNEAFELGKSSHK
jgi:hypothetical protein